jgi:hypothetical protein
MLLAGGPSHDGFAPNPGIQISLWLPGKQTSADQCCPLR